MAKKRKKAKKRATRKARFRAYLVDHGEGQFNVIVEDHKEKRRTVAMEVLRHIGHDGKVFYENLEWREEYPSTDAMKRSAIAFYKESYL